MPEIIDAEFTVVSEPKPHLRDPAWLALPWWRKYRIHFAPGTLEAMLITGALGAMGAAAAVIGRH